MNNFIPVRGMKDFLPCEANLREKIRQDILNKYQSHGFNLIETAAIENLSFLERNSENSDNQKLIFKILKRGEKLSNALNTQSVSELDIAELGLRFDLTVPLTRYYQNNKSELPKICKTIQIGNVWRAEKPQKGRYRQFTQCDIDIIGSDSISAEFDLLTTAMELLNNLLVSKFTIKINNRQLLDEVFKKCLQTQDINTEKLFIIVDKKNKIGLDNVAKEIQENFPNFNINTLIEYINNPKMSSKLQNLVHQLEKYIKIKKLNCSIEFDSLLSRGMNYYTGTVFEIVANNYIGSISGGGRYDNLISQMPACGLSIGFERIIEIIMDQNTTQELKLKLALVLETEDLAEILNIVQTLADKKMQISILPYPSSKSGQDKLRNNLKKERYTHIYLSCKNYQSKEIEQL